MAGPEQQDKKVDADDTTTTAVPATQGEKNEGGGTTISSTTIQRAPDGRAARKATDMFSEHGHSLAQIRPMAKHSGTSVSTFLNGLFTTIIGIATLGASITFSYILSDHAPTPESSHPAFTPAQVQEFLAVSWLLFLLALAFGALGSTLLTFFKKHWIADWDGVNGRTSQWTVQMYVVIASGLLGGLIIGAFVLLCLVVVAYSAVVGWVALGFACFFGFIICVGVMNQIPWPWRDNTPSAPTAHHV